jgi:hypothetical protein
MDAAGAGLPSIKVAKPQLPVAAYFVESLTMNWTFVGGPATKDCAWPKTLLFSSDAT